MHITVLEPESPVQVAALRRVDERTLGWIGLGAIIVLAAVLRFANLSALGDANHYYAAAVKAMLQSWHNFFFVAAEPGGSVSVDKPPLGLWIQTLSAYFLGVNTLGLLFPEILAGLSSVAVVYHLVRRSFGTVAGLVAALALAVTPVVVATDRNNTIDSTLILTLLLAAWAFIKATETGKLYWLMLGAALVGLGFNIKMLEAFLPLPAFYALYFLGSKERLLFKIGKLTLATGVLLAISLSWITIVDLTPADQRPYVGSSSDNSEWSLALGYNGVERLVGMGGRGGLLNSLLNGNAGRGGGRFNPGPNGGFPQGGGAPFGGLLGGGVGGPGGMFETGQPGLLRLFIPPLSKEASWLLPLSLVSALVLTFRSRLTWPLAPKHQAMVLWGGWLMTGAVFFSIAGFFHQYYLYTIAPPVAALAGIVVAELWGLARKHPWIARAIWVGASLVTLMLQFTTATAFTPLVWWLPLVLGLFLIGCVFVFSGRQVTRLTAAGFACIVAALLVTPGVWSGLTTLNSSANQSLPAAYDGRSSGPANRGAAQVNEALLNYMEANTQNMKYLMAVPSSMQGSDYVLATGRPVLYLGGFMGQDRVETAADLQRMVANGELRYIYWDGRGGNGFGMRGNGSQSDISTWVTSACHPVQGFDTATQNQGAPDGTGGGFGNPGFRGGMQVSLYDCAG
ncbi:MAG: glycosyltransferase family 39 protein [Anaerolineae bacterium]